MVAALQPNPNLWNNPPAGFGPLSIAEVLDDPGLSDIHMSNEQGRSTWPWQINWVDSKTVLTNIRTILGYSYTAGASLKRVTPMKHPLFPWMWAREIGGWKPKGYTGKENLGRGQAAAWTRLELTVSYWIPPYAIMTDNVAITGEWQRYCERKWKPATKIVSSDKAEFQFYNVPPGTSPTYATTIKQSVARQQMEGLYEYIWHEVPASFINSADENGFPNGPPGNILYAVGKVNSVAFNGHNPGTLLLETPDFHPFAQPIGETLGDPVDGTAPPLIYTVTLPMKKFDPPLGGADPNQENVSQSNGDYRLQGHNTRIHQASQYGLAYPIRTIAGQAPLYKGVPFDNIFKKAT